MINETSNKNTLSLSPWTSVPNLLHRTRNFFRSFLGSLMNLRIQLIWKNKNLFENIGGFYEVNVSNYNDILQTLVVLLTNLMFSTHREFNEEFLRVRANEYKWGIRFALRKLFAIFFLAKNIGHVHTSQQATGWKERRKAHTIDWKYWRRIWQTWFSNKITEGSLRKASRLKTHTLWPKYTLTYKQCYVLISRCKIGDSEIELRYFL